LKGMSTFAAKIGKALAEPVISLAETEPEMLGKIFLGLGSISAAAVGYYVNQYNENLKKVKEGMVNFENVLIKSDAAREKTMFDFKEKVSNTGTELKQEITNLKAEIKDKVSEMKTEFQMEFMKMENGLKSDIMESKVKSIQEVNSIQNQLNILALNFSQIQEKQAKFLHTLGNDKNLLT